MLLHVSVLYSFLRLNNLPLYVYITFCLYIHLLSDTWVAHHLLLDVIVPALSSLGTGSCVVLPLQAQCPNRAWHRPGRGSVGIY